MKTASVKAQNLWSYPGCGYRKKFDACQRWRQCNLKPLKQTGNRFSAVTTRKASFKMSHSSW